MIKYIQINKATDSDWFTITSSKDGIRWCDALPPGNSTFGTPASLINLPQGSGVTSCRSGKCWYVHELLKYEFDFEFDIPATYPSTAPEIQLPELDGKTAKMYRGGKICLTVHFKPLWAKNRCVHEHFAWPLALSVRHARIQPPSSVLDATCCVVSVTLTVATSDKSSC